MDYEDWTFPFGKYKGKTIAEIPSSYLDWLIGQDWFVKRPGNRDWLQAIGEELTTRKRSGYEPQSGQDEEYDFNHK